MQRAVYLEAELRSTVQGDLSMNDYYTKLKQITDQLRHIGHPISEPSQVLNLLRGLNPKLINITLHQPTINPTRIRLSVKKLT